MKKPKVPTAFVTGVSTGIGLATCRKLAEEGFVVFGSVRTERDANRLQRMMGENYKPIIMDVTDESSVMQAYGLVKDQLEGRVLDLLVNNAGIAQSGPLELLTMDQMRHQFEVNVLAVWNIIRVFLPLLKPTEQNLPGKIINISSISGIFTTPFMGPYCSSKAALESLTDAYRRELSLYGIPVISILPGPVKTEIWRKAKETKHEYPASVYDPYLKVKDKIIDKRSSGAIPAENVAHLIYKIYLCKNPRTRYFTSNTAFLFKLFQRLPDKWVDRLIMKLLKPK